MKARFGLVVLLLTALLSAPAFAKNYGHSKLQTYFSCLGTPLAVYDGTILDAATDPNNEALFGTLATAAGLADPAVIETLGGPGPLTVYAPINEAFDAVPAPLLQLLLGDSDLLTAVLTYHVSAGTLDPRKAYFPREARTAQGQTVFFNRGKSGAQVNQANIVDCQGVKTDNGVVWVIDSVLLPQFLVGNP